MERILSIVIADARMSIEEVYLSLVKGEFKKKSEEEKFRGECLKGLTSCPESVLVLGFES